MLSNLKNSHKLQVEEEEYLIQELKKIELRKKEREKKTQDLQKLITAADSNSEIRKGDRKAVKKKLPVTQKFREPSKVDWYKDSPEKKNFIRVISRKTLQVLSEIAVLRQCLKEFEEIHSE